MLSVRGIYDGKKLKLLEQIRIRTPRKVIITFLDIDNDDLTSEEMHLLADQGGAFDFLKDVEEDIYTDKDLSVIYPG